MDSKRATSLRGWMRKHPTVGPVLVGRYLGLHYLWPRQRVALVASAFLIGCIFACILWLPRHADLRVSEPPTFMTRSQPTVPPSSSSFASTSSIEKSENDKHYYAWFAAAAKGDNPRVRRLLHEGTYVDALGERGTALTYAAENGHLSTVKLLMAAGATLHACDSESVLFDCTFNTALDGAADGGHAAVVRYLLRKGVHPNESDDNGYTPLLRAAACRQSNTVRVLLAFGADPNTQSRHFGYSALMLAAEAGATDSVRALLRRGADVRAEDQNGHTAIWYARRAGHGAILSMLRKAARDRHARNRNSNE